VQHLHQHPLRRIDIQIYCVVVKYTYIVYVSGVLLLDWCDTDTSHCDDKLSYLYHMYVCSIINIVEVEGRVILY
jgi:hypothetical protein